MSREAMMQDVPLQAKDFGLGRSSGGRAPGPEMTRRESPTQREIEAIEKLIASCAAGVNAIRDLLTPVSSAINEATRDRAPKEGPQADTPLAQCLFGLRCQLESLEELLDDTRRRITL